MRYPSVCSECEQALQKDSSTCPHCGAKIDAETASGVPFDLTAPAAGMESSLANIKMAALALDAAKHIIGGGAIAAGAIGAAKIGVPMWQTQRQQQINDAMLAEQQQAAVGPFAKTARAGNPILHIRKPGHASVEAALKAFRKMAPRKS